MPSHARNKLSARQVTTITKPGIYGDGGGLYLRIRPNGRSWLFIGTLKPKGQFRIKGTGGGAKVELGLGSVADVGLAKARELAAQMREMLLEGIDPRVERLKTRKAEGAGTESVITFGKFAIELVDSIEDGFKNPKHRQQWRNTLTTYAQPLFAVPIDEVTTEQILAVLQPIWLSKAETASRLRGRIERVLDAAKVKGLRSGENPARGRGHLDLLLPKRSKTSVKHHPALPFVQVAGFVADVRGRPAMAARALEFVILTAGRSGEVRGMTWGELDLEASIWTVPADRMKAGVTHEVPLNYCDNTTGS